MVYQKCFHFCCTGIRKFGTISGEISSKTKQQQQTSGTRLHRFSCIYAFQKVNLVFNIHTGDGGKGLWKGGGGRGRLLYLSLHCHHQNDSCIKMGSGENHFNVSLIVRDKVTRQYPETTIFEEKGELKQIHFQTEVPLLTSLIVIPYC